jgi:folate-dependent phosphoribosylglycinamide formyltransferase PurN
VSGARVPAAVLMSGTGSNARKILERAQAAYEVRVIVSDNPASNYRRIAEDFGVAHRLNDIYEFCGTPHPGAGRRLSPEHRAALRDPARRAVFDRRTEAILDAFGALLAAAAGYDWVISPRLCGRYFFVNVHPGDLRVVDERGRRRYVGLAWVPSAKAMLAGEGFVRSSTHLVTAALDGGPIARVSGPVPVELPPGVGPTELLPPGSSLRQVIEDIRAGGARFGRSLLYREACRLQERLKETGDWVEFPRTLDGVARLLLTGRLGRGAAGQALLDGSPVRDLFLQDD